MLLSSNVREIGTDAVRIEADGDLLKIPNQGVIDCAGGILPTGFLKEIGVEIETTYDAA